MTDSKLLDNKNEKYNSLCSEKLYKGACVKIKNSKKTFQVIGFNLDSKKTFALDITQIKLQIFCSYQSSK